MVSVGTEAVVATEKSARSRLEGPGGLRRLDRTVHRLTGGVAGGDSSGFFAVALLDVSDCIAEQIVRT